MDPATRPAIPTLGLKHLALKVTDLKRSQAFYETLFGMQVVWQPDAENVYLSSGRDNLALHQIPSGEVDNYRKNRGQYLDHFGFIMASVELVDRMHDRVGRDGGPHGAKIVKPPKQHRDGSYSFYLADPDGNVIQILYEPTLSRNQHE